MSIAEKSPDLEKSDVKSSRNRLVGAHLNQILAAHSPPRAHAARTLRLPLDLVQVALLLRLGSLSLPPDDVEHVAQGLLPGVQARGDLAPLLLAEDAVCSAVDEEHLLLLRQLALDKSGADDVDDPHLNLLCWDLKGLCDALVLELAAVGGGSKGGEGEETHLAVELLTVQVVVLEEGVVLVAEVVVVLELLLGDDLEQLGPDGLGVGERLHGGEGSEVEEIEVDVGEERGF